MQVVEPALVPEDLEHFLRNFVPRPFDDTSFAAFYRALYQAEDAIERGEYGIGGD
jgi:hypothetical protein